ncbi:hypothetical protein [Lapidilactobacillus luobeiensis]|uniref:hypothetical protein n=1 Tax=Lapidilactobacillus luobeiensis TaxID=2950371 RepID=UPI0021C353EF|nr:hypothetical protein [Lapidilactobacillus luobeiensis]
MSRSKLNATYLFLFTIPYVIAILLVASAYNTLVVHWSSWWRLCVGGVVGAAFLTALKITIQRPLNLLVLQDAKSAVGFFGRFFLIRGNPRLLVFNYVLDFILCIAGVYAIRMWFAQSLVMWGLIGWLILIMFVSTAIGSYLAYDILSIDPDQK